MSSRQETFECLLGKSPCFNVPCFANQSDNRFVQMILQIIRKLRIYVYNTPLSCKVCMIRSQDASAFSLKFNGQLGRLVCEAEAKLEADSAAALQGDRSAAALQGDHSAVTLQGDRSAAELQGDHSDSHMNGFDDPRQQHPGDSIRKQTVGSREHSSEHRPDDASEHRPDDSMDGRSGSGGDGSAEPRSDRSSKGGGGRLLIGHSLGAACVAAEAIDQPQVPLSERPQ